MVHASSVDHVPIHAYGVNLSLHFDQGRVNDGVLTLVRCLTRTLTILSFEHGALMVGIPSGV